MTFRPILLLLALLLLLPTAARGQSLYADPVARRPGDIITIILAEQTTAQRQSSYDDEAGASLGGGGGVDVLTSRFAADAQLSREAYSSNQTVQSDLLRGTITARVTAVDEAGNLIIEGERRLNVNGVTHLMTVSGMVRPFDVSYNNSILSHQIANAQIEYRRTGFTRGWFSPGFFLKLGAAALIGVAAFFGLQ